MSAMPNDFNGPAERDETDRAGADRPDVEGPGRDGSDEAAVAGTPVVVRRHAGIAALIGAAASAVAIAYLWRASQTTTALDWTLCGVMAVIAAYYLVSLVDSRTPLLVADDLGVRIRLGDEWRGLPWDAIGQVVVHPRKGFLRDGRLVFVPRSLARALEGLDAKGRRHAALNQKMYGAALAVPVGTTTRVSTAGERSVAEEIAALALGRADVVELAPRSPEVAEPRTDDGAAQADVEAAEAAWTAEDLREEPGAQGPARVPAQDRREVFPRLHPGEAASPAEPRLETTAPVRMDEPVVERPGSSPATQNARATTDAGKSAEGAAAEDSATGEPASRAPRRSILGGIGMIVSRVAKGRSHDIDGEGPIPGAGDVDRPDAPATPAPMSLTPTAALRETRPGLRAEATLNLPTAGSTALDPSAADQGSRADMPEGRELRRPGSVDLV
ncbi:MAG TPA: hypothetical protein VK204_00870, partial [Nocardioidaceae bacterium]|nr:hypothetical protein [Nocardioidaceae bacterium]